MVGTSHWTFDLYEVHARAGSQYMRMQVYFIATKIVSDSVEGGKMDRRERDNNNDKRKDKGASESEEKRRERLYIRNQRDRARRVAESEEHKKERLSKRRGQGRMQLKWWRV